MVKPRIDVNIREDLIKPKRKAKPLRCSSCSMYADWFCSRCEARQRVTTMCKKHLRGTPEEPLCGRCFEEAMKEAEVLARSIENMSGNVAMVKK